MRALLGAVALSVMLAAAPTFAQAPAQQPPAQPAPAAPAPAPRPFPDGAKYAFVSIPRIASESAEGKASTARVQALNEQKVKELNEKNKQLQAAQQKLEAGATVLSDQARAQLQKEIERQQIDIQRFTEDAQQEIAGLQQQLQADFERKLTPVLDQVAREKGLHLLFSMTDSGLVWGDPSLDITADVITKFNATAGSAAAPAAPAAPAPAPRPPAQP